MLQMDSTKMIYSKTILLGISILLFSCNNYKARSDYYRVCLDLTVPLVMLATDSINNPNLSDAERAKAVEDRDMALLEVYKCRYNYKN